MSSLEHWLNCLTSEDIIVADDKIKRAVGTTSYTLSPPIEICISSVATDRLRKRYRADREIGGILLAEPLRNERKKILVIDRIRFIKNVSDKPKEKYLAAGDHINHIHRCLVGTKAGKHYLPIWFHSHPIEEPNFSQAVMSYFEMVNSEQDMKVATNGITYKSLGKSLYFPSALMLVTAEDDLFVGIYGGHVAPADLKHAILEILGKAGGDLAKATWNWGFDKDASNLRKVGGVLGTAAVIGALVVTSASLFSRNTELVSLVNRFASDLQRTNEEKRYLGISKHGELSINVPQKK